MTTRIAKWLSAFVVLIMLVVVVPQTTSAEELPTVVITEDTVLTSDLNAHVVIGADGITLDGAGHYVTGDYTGVGINLTGRSGVTVKNCCIALFNYGILLSESHDNTLASNTVTLTGDWIVLEESAIFLDSSDRNTLTGNIVNGRFQKGFDILSSDRNVLMGNMVSGAYHIFSSTGFKLEGSNHNTLTSNTASVCGNYGFLVIGWSNHNFITGNTAQVAACGFHVGGHGNKVSNNIASNNGAGFVIQGRSQVEGNLAVDNSRGFKLIEADNSTLSRNTARDNEMGFSFWSCWGCSLVNNTATSNIYGFWVDLYDIYYCKFMKNWICGNRGTDLIFQPGGAGSGYGHNLFIKNVFGTILPSSDFPYP